MRGRHAHGSRCSAGVESPASVIYLSIASEQRIVRVRRFETACLSVLEAMAHME